MEEQSLENNLQLTTLDFGGNSISSGSCYHFPATAHQTNGNPLVFNTVPSWMYCQQTSQNYVDFMSENGGSGFGKKITIFNPSMSSGFAPMEISTNNAGLEVQPYPVCILCH